MPRLCGPGMSATRAFSAWLARPFSREEAYHSAWLRKYGDGVAIAATLLLIAAWQPIEKSERPVGRNGGEQGAVPPAPALGSGFGVNELSQHPAKQDNDGEQKGGLNGAVEPSPSVRFFEDKTSHDGDPREKHQNPFGHTRILARSPRESIA